MNNWQKILVAVDATPTSEKAVKYIGDIAGKLKDVNVCLLHIYPEPPPGYYASGKSLPEYQKAKESEAAVVFANALAILQKYGIKESAISRECRMADHATISQTIINVQEDGQYGTIVVGKRGVSKAEEFLFGSISNALVHHSKDVAVWVIG